MNSLVGGGEPLSPLPAPVDTQAQNQLLFDAVMAGKLSDAEHLILSGTSASCVDDQMRTPLHYAAYNGDRDMAALLCDYTADIETRDSAVRRLARFAHPWPHAHPLRHRTDFLNASFHKPALKRNPAGEHATARLSSARFDTDTGISSRVCGDG